VFELRVAPHDPSAPARTGAEAAGKEPVAEAAAMK